MFENFPYTDMHQLNLDWIIKIAKDFLDQYTQIQQIITEGEQALQDKADELEGLLQEWYDTHSADIAEELKQALQELNAWYIQHEDYLNETLTTNINIFNQRADEKAAETIATIPDDYTALFNQVQDIQLQSNMSFSDNIPFGETIIYDYEDLPVLSEHHYISQLGVLTPETSGVTSSVVMIPARGIKRISITATADQDVFTSAYIVVLNRLSEVDTYMFSGDLLTSADTTYTVTLNRNGFDFNTFLAINWIGRTGETVVTADNITIEYYTRDEWYLTANINSVSNKTFDIYIPSLPVYDEGKYMNNSGNLITQSNANIRIFDADLIDEISVTFEAGHDGYPSNTTPIAILKDGSGNLVNILNPTTAGTYTMAIDHRSAYNGTLYINEFDANGRYRLWQTFGGTDVFAPYHLTAKQRFANLKFNYHNNIRKPFDFYNKNVVFVGDSITAGVINTNPNIEYTTETYPKLFGAATGANVTNIAVAGACYYKPSNPGQLSTLEQLQTISGTPDYIFIAAGVNDWLFGTTESNFRASVQAVYTYLHNNFPNVPTIFITPINCYEWTGYPQNLKIMELQEYRNMISEEILANDWSQFSIIQGSDFNFPEKPCLSAYANAVFGDGLHPSVIGYRCLYTPKLLELLL